MANGPAVTTGETYMKKLSKFAAGFALALCLAGVASPALAESSDPQPTGVCIKEPWAYCAF
jgi:hypothetical protein